MAARRLRFLLGVTVLLDVAWSALMVWSFG
ncbi:MAG: hypothetical protein JWQ36_840 [Enterovirga sp.]|nr:hypothetical protein [Enterovirga sp.]